MWFRSEGKTQVILRMEACSLLFPGLIVVQDGGQTIKTPPRLVECKNRGYICNYSQLNLKR